MRNVLSDQARHYARAIALKIVKNKDDADDVTQDALLNAYRFRDSFRGDSRFSTWLHQVVVTTALMHLRKQRGRAAVTFAVGEGDTSELLENTAGGGSSPEETASTNQVLARTSEQVRSFPGRYHEVFWMRFAGGYTDEEIAKELGLKVRTVKSRAYRARSRIRKTLMSAVAG